ncbi:ryanodine receptor 1-like [Corapipo altera]|uniref:ryanodine receptor 1-like n=1 Tax=Corapipo altera TaxID=415028 RepID=UPI000FD67DCB|nr:ryanodine receptor 1-like [Corapipo altera]
MALTEQSQLEQNHLYMAYAGIMAKSCHMGEGEEEEEKEEAEDSFEEKEMEKQKLLSQQHTWGAAEMVLQMISACKGEWGATGGCNTHMTHVTHMTYVCVPPGPCRASSFLCTFEVIKLL